MPRFDFDHIDPRTGFASIKKRPEDDINPMNILPRRSCWVKMLQNRVNLNSVGNLRYARTVWFDIRTKRVSEDRFDTENAVMFRTYKLPCGQPARGWIEVNSRR